MVDKISTVQHDAYERIHASADFQDLRKRFRRFVLPATIGFLTWYFLYVIASNWAPGFMGTYLIGNINVAFVFGLLQFVSTFALAFVYAKYANKAFDPIAERLEKQYVREIGDGSGR